MAETSAHSILTPDLAHTIPKSEGLVRIPFGYDGVIGAFEGDGSIAHVELSYGMRFIGDRAFSCCSRLEGIDIPDSIVAIGDYAFSSCSGLREVILPPGVKRIGTCAFAHCNSLKRVVLPPSIEEIGVDAFAACSSDLVFAVETGSFAYTFLQQFDRPRISPEPV